LDPTGKGDEAEVLHLKLTPEGEDRMLDALGLNATQMELVTKDVEQHGVHPADTLHADIAQIARSYNARLKKGETIASIAEVNLPRLDELEKKFTELQGK